MNKSKKTYHIGITHSTNIRFWEFSKEFRQQLIDEKVQAIEMECATLFSVGFARSVPIGALMLISDLPLKPDGVKTAKSAKSIFSKYTQLHINMGIEIMQSMRDLDESDHCYEF